MMPAEVAAEAVGPRGTTFAMIVELEDGRYRLFDRCAEGLTPDGTAFDEVYDDEMSARWDAVRLVEVWAA